MGKWIFWVWLKLQKSCNQSCSSKCFGLSEMSFRLVCASDNLPQCYLYMWKLQTFCWSCKNIAYECTACKFTHSKQTDEKWIAKPFKMERPNGWRDDKNFSTDEWLMENFWTDVVKWMSGWKKFLSGRNRTDEQLKKK